MIYGRNIFESVEQNLNILSPNYRALSAKMKLYVYPFSKDSGSLTMINTLFGISWYFLIHEVCTLLPNQFDQRHLWFWETLLSQNLHAFTQFFLYYRLLCLFVSCLYLSLSYIKSLKFSKLLIKSSSIFFVHANWFFPVFCIFQTSAIFFSWNNVLQAVFQKVFYMVKLFR